MSFHHSSRERHGFRFWWHTCDRSVFSIEFYWWTRFCHASLQTRENRWTWSLALPPLAIWVSFDGFGLWYPQRKCIATWDNQREFLIPDDRECAISIHDWTVRLTPWGRLMEWSSRDPWWVNGFRFDIPDRLLGRTTYQREVLKGDIPLLIPMPEGTYRAVAAVTRCTWKRPRWFARTRIFTDVQIPKGIPFAGKGENSWDCGDDGLFGYSSEGDSLERAIAKGVESVLKSRRRHGNASPETIADALAG